MDLLFFITYCLLITITPGPTNIVILSTVQNNGVKKAIEFCYGATFAFGIILFLSVLFNSLLTKYIPNLLLVMQIIGGIYILYLAYLIFNMDLSNTNKKEVGSFKTGFLMQFINPKVVIFCLTIFPSFVMPYYSLTYELLVFAFIITIIGAIAFFSWVLFGKILKSFLEKYKRFTNIVLSLFLVYCAYMISGVGNYF
ncbi:LysE family translocator [Arcobacter sp. YIC-464]|uniref:LysE family translocator n=1 Tax=Arcobacter sp. YIC-464 TaxID=3376631 RepID=UPI003C14777E